MEFTLRYSGTMLRPQVGRDARLDEKHALRLDFHKQLQELWRTDPRLSPIDPKTLQEPIPSEHMRFDVQRKILSPAHAPLFGYLYQLRLNGFRFIPLVTEPMEARCQLAIRWGRPTKPGRIIFSGGDIDGRLKTLFDSLRMPHTPSELPANIRGTDELCFCLLADDNVITKVSVESYRLLGDFPSDAHSEVDIDVTIRAVTPMLGTYSLLFD